MNETLSDFDNALSHDYQNKVRLNLSRTMATRPMSAAAYARGIGISVQSLLRFLRGSYMNYKVIMTIERYMDDNK